MKACVLVLAPADQPGVDILVLPDQLEDAGVRVVADEVLPAISVGHEPFDEPLQLGA